jgi:hypothetical protein
MRTRVQLHLVTAALLGLLQLFPGLAQAQIADPDLWVTDGSVFATALVGDTLYVGGSFTWVGPQTGAFARIDASSGQFAAGWPRVRGEVYAVAFDGLGGWYIGGSFTSVGAGWQRTAHQIGWTLDGWNLDRGPTPTSTP